MFIGTPPVFRGTLLPGKDIDIVVALQFPSASLFVEKPVATARVGDVHHLTRRLDETNTFVAVGYMLRYLKGLYPNLTNVVVQKMKEIIAEKGLVVASTNALYQSTYATEDHCLPIHNLFINNSILVE